MRTPQQPEEFGAKNLRALGAEIGVDFRERRDQAAVVRNQRLIIPVQRIGLAQQAAATGLVVDVAEALGDLVDGLARVGDGHRLEHCISKWSVKQYALKHVFWFWLVPW
jgi:hypothetical protein